MYSISRDELAYAEADGEDKLQETQRKLDR